MSAPGTRAHQLPTPSADAPKVTPAALVLGGGGILGEAWMSALLAGLDEQPDFDSRECRAYVGTSAGSIVAASLVAGIAPGSRLGRLPEPPAVPHDSPQARALPAQFAAPLLEIGGAALGTVAALALASSSHGGALVRRAVLGRIPDGRRSLGDLRRELRAAGAAWDERLRIVVVDASSGRRVVLTRDGRPRAAVEDAVLASCAIPGVFRPVRIDRRSYVDGGAWSPANLDVARVQSGDAVLCLNPTGSLRPTLDEPIGALGPVSRMITAAEALTLRRRGARVVTVNPDSVSASLMGTDLMDPGPRAAVIYAGLAQGRRLAAGVRTAPAPLRDVA